MFDQYYTMELESYLSMNNEAAALAKWTEHLPQEDVVIGQACMERYGPNVTEYRFRRVVAALRPRSVDDVVRIVRVARRFGVPLYPLSKGANWGLGSKQPPGDGYAIVDLSEMKQILELDTKLGHAVVQPGVDQGSLARRLRKENLPWMLNVTGAGALTSVVGNALERGIGMLQQRHHDILAVEAVLGTSKVVRLGFDHLYYPTGAGPDLSGLFAQSGYGIVTALAIRLYPRQEACLFFAETDADRLPDFIDGLRFLRQRGLLRHRTEIMAENDSRLIGRIQRGKGTWGTWGTVYGDASMRQTLRVALRATLETSCRTLHFFDSSSVSKERLPSDLAARFELAQGVPSNYTIETIQGRTAVNGTPEDIDFDPSIPGMLAVLPAVPLVGQSFQRLVDLVSEVSRSVGVVPVMSFSTVSEVAAEGFVRVHFDRRSSDAVERAHRWAQALDTRLRQASVPFVRLNLEQMKSSVAGDKTVRQVQHAIWRSLDPSQIISPGRYVGA